MSMSAARADTLAEAMASAYETNPQLLSGRANLRAQDEAVAQARGGLRPDVRANLEYGLDYNDARQVTSETQDPFSATLSASQPLYDGGVTYNAVRGRIADVSAARAQLAALEQQVLFDAVTAYVDVLRDQQVVSFARNNVRVITEQLRATRDRFEVGEVTRTDVSQAEARLAEANANLASVLGALETSRQNYREVVGAEPLSLDPPPPLPPLPATLQEAVDTALAQHPEMIAARFAEVSAARDVRAAIGQLLPDVSLEASTGYNDGVFENDVTDSTSARVGVRAVIPLYQRGVAYSQVRQNQALASAARADITIEARERRRVAEFAWSQLEVAQAVIRAQREGVRAAQLAFEGVREESIVGSRTTLDVLDAEQELLDARTDLVSAERDEYVAGYGLLLAVGGLTAAERGLTVTAYDPDVNYSLNNARFFGFDRTDDTVWAEPWRP
jgi:outer membrane protein